jgi:hypothetical protein
MLDIGQVTEEGISMSEQLMRIGLIGGLVGSIVLLGGCSTNRTATTNRSTGQSEVRQAPDQGPSANQSAWEQGRVPQELQRMPSASSQPPVPGENSYTSTTAPTGETSTMPTQPTSSATGSTQAYGTTPQSQANR